MEVEPDNLLSQSESEDSEPQADEADDASQSRHDWGRQVSDDDGVFDSDDGKPDWAMLPVKDQEKYHQLSSTKLAKKVEAD
jgi:hypothetical protein